MRCRVLSSFFVLFFATSAPALAGVAEDVARDLKPGAGVLIMPADGEYLVDLDASRGVRVGDLLAVVTPGEKVVHPVTRELLGTLDRVKGVLRVTRVKEGFSFARPIRAEGDLARGDAVRRFSGVPAAFWDYTGDGRTLYDQLRTALPGLEWQGYDEAQKGRPVRPEVVEGAPPLIFVLREGRLEVRGPDFGELYAYPLTPAARAESVPAPAAVVPAPVAPPAPQPAIVRNRSTEAEGLSYPAEFEGEIVGLEVGDLDADGKQEVAVAFPFRLEIGRIAAGKYERLQELELGYGRKVLAVDGADLDGDGRMELYLTAADGGNLHSFTVAFDGRYRITRENIPWYFRTVPLPGEGPVLLAQRMGGPAEDFSGPLFRAALEGKSLTEGKPVASPKGISLYGFLPFSTAQGERLFAQINAWDRLKVLRPDGEILWESEERFGGSEEFIERIDPARTQSSNPNTRNAFLQQRMAVGDKGELLIPANEGSRLLSRSRSFDKSRIRGMAWNGFTMQEIWHTQPQQGYLADFRLADVDNDGRKELVQGVVFTRKGLLRKGRSALGVIELP